MFRRETRRETSVLNLQIEITPPPRAELGKKHGFGTEKVIMTPLFRQLSIKNRESSSNLKIAPRARQIADMADDPAVSGLALFASREVKVFSD